MPPKLHTVLRIAFALFLIVSGAKHLYTVYWGDPTIMATGYPEPGAEAFILAVLETKFLLPLISTTKVIAGVLMVLPKREPLGRSGGVSLQRGNADVGLVCGAEPPADHGRNLCPQCRLGLCQLERLQIRGGIKLGQLDLQNESGSRFSLEGVLVDYSEKIFPKTLDFHLSKSMHIEEVTGIRWKEFTKSDKCFV